MPPKAAKPRTPPKARKSMPKPKSKSMSKGESADSPKTSKRRAPLRTPRLNNPPGLKTQKVLSAKIGSGRDIWGTEVKPKGSLSRMLANSKTFHGTDKGMSGMGARVASTKTRNPVRLQVLAGSDVRAVYSRPQVVEILGEPHTSRLLGSKPRAPAMTRVEKRERKITRRDRFDV